MVNKFTIITQNNKQKNKQTYPTDGTFLKSNRTMMVIKHYQTKKQNKKQKTKNKNRTKSNKQKNKNHATLSRHLQILIE